MFNLKPGQHDYQQFTDSCLRCGYNAYDKNFPTICPGNYNRHNKEQERKRKAEQKKIDKEWGDGPW